MDAEQSERVVQDIMIEVKNLNRRLITNRIRPKLVPLALAYVNRVSSHGPLAPETMAARAELLKEYPADHFVPRRSTSLRRDREAVAGLEVSVRKELAKKRKEKKRKKRKKKDTGKRKGPR